jgi:hypothetical protein
LLLFRRFFDTGSRGRPIWLYFLLLLFLLRLGVCLAQNFIDIRVRGLSTGGAFVHLLKEFIGGLTTKKLTSGSKPATIFWGLASTVAPVISSTSLIIFCR